MQLMTSWERKGRAEGWAEGRAQGQIQGEIAVVKRQLQRRFGSLGRSVEKELERLSLERLEALAEALLDFTGPQDLVRWLDKDKKRREPRAGSSSDRSAL